MNLLLLLNLLLALIDEEPAILAGPEWDPAG